MGNLIYNPYKINTSNPSQFNSKLNYNNTNFSNNNSPFATHGFNKYNENYFSSVPNGLYTQNEKFNNVLSASTDLYDVNDSNTPEWYKAYKSNANTNNNTQDTKPNAWKSLGSMASGMGLQLAGNTEMFGKDFNGNTAERGLWDTLDPMHYASNGRHTGMGDGIENAGVTLAQTGNPWLMLVGAGLKAGGGIVNGIGGHTIDETGRTNIEAARNMNKNSFADYSSNANFTSSFNNFNTNVAGPNKKKYKDGWLGFNKNGTNAYRNDLNKIYQSNQYAINNLSTAQNNLSKNNADMAMLNSKPYAFGGALEYSTMMDNFNMQQNRINANNNKINSLPNSFYDNTMLSQFAFGGDTESNGATWDTGSYVVNNGGTHEENPNGGVAVSIDPEGKQNTVEEGEYVWNDYVFSKRLIVPTEFKKELGLKSSGDLSFADAAIKLSNESEERPNDSISKASKDAMLNRLREEQEKVREEKGAKEQQEQQIQQEEQNTLAQQEMQSSPEEEQMAQVDGMNQQPSQKELMQQQMMPAPMMQAYGDNLNKFANGGMIINPLQTNKDNRKEINQFSGTNYNISTNQMSIGDYKSLYYDPTYGYENYLNSIEDSIKHKTWNLPYNLNNVNISKPFEITEDPIEIDNDPVDDVVANLPIQQKQSTKPQTNLQIKTSKLNPNWLENLQYANVPISFGQYANLKKPDYSRLDQAIASANYQPLMTSYNNIGGKQRTNLVDTMNGLNQLNAQNAAGINNFINLSNGNPANARAMAMMQNNNYLNAIGNYLAQANAENKKNKLTTAQFNLGIDQANATGNLSALQANQNALTTARNNYASRLFEINKLKDAYDSQYETAKMAALSNLGNNLAGVGTETYNKRMLQHSIDTGMLKDIVEGAEKSNAYKAKQNTTTNAYGGQLLTKSRNKKGGRK